MTERVRAVVRVRTLFERLALGGLAGAEQRTRRAASAVEARRRALARRPAGPQVLSPLELRALQLQGLGAHDLLQAAEDELEEAEAARAERERAWRHATRDRKSAERLAARRDEERVAGARRASQAALDELAALRWGSG